MKSANNVLHIINGEYYAGAERVQDLLASNLDQFGYSAYFACLCRGVFRKFASCDQEKIFDFPMRSRLDYGIVFRLARFIRYNEITLVHSHTPRSALIALLVSRISRIGFVHHQHSPSLRETNQGLRDKLNARLEAFAARRADSVIVVSSSLRDYCIEVGVDLPRINIVFNGVPVGNQVPRHRNPTFPARLAIIALIRPRKGIETLLEALSSVQRIRSDFKLAVIGDFIDSQYRDDVYALARRLGVFDKVLWKGFSPDVYQELSEIDLMVLPSLFGEGLPMVILEAMANQVPVIASNVEGAQDALPNETIGKLVPPGDVTRLADAIVEYLGDSTKFEDCASRASLRQAEYFSDLSMARGVSTVYDKLLKNC